MACGVWGVKTRRLCLAARWRALAATGPTPGARMEGIIVGEGEERSGLLANLVCFVSKCVLWCFAVFCGCFAGVLRCFAGVLWCFASVL